MSKRILFLSGSTRKDSYNTLLAKAACKIASQKGIDAEFIDLAEYPMPLFDQDIEAESGAPETAKLLKEHFRNADGFFIASPEYNSTITPILKNTIDWLSRPYEKDEPRLVCFDNKAAAICATSPGGLGGLRALDPLRLLLSHINVNVVGQQLAIPSAHEAFDANGDLKSEMHNAIMSSIIDTLARIA